MLKILTVTAIVGIAALYSDGPLIRLSGLLILASVLIVLLIHVYGGSL